MTESAGSGPVLRVYRVPREVGGSRVPRMLSGVAGDSAAVQRVCGSGERGGCDCGLRGLQQSSLRDEPCHCADHYTRHIVMSLYVVRAALVAIRIVLLMFY